jgi:hypothetical protein
MSTKQTLCLAESGHTDMSVEELVCIKSRGLDDFLARRSEGRT